MYTIAAYNDILAKYRTSSMIYSIICFVVIAVGLYKMFQKAGITEWYAFIPILNAWETTKIACGSGLYLLLILIPCVGPLIYVIFLAVKLSPAFGKGIGTTLLLIFLAPIAYLYLGFGDAQYRGPQ